MTNIELKIKTQPFMGKQIDVELNGFFINHSNNTYLISVHHNLPIDTIHELDTNTELRPKINCCWNELLVINYYDPKYCVYKEIRNKLPKKDNILTIRNNGCCLETVVIDYDFIPWDNIDDNYRLPYIRSKIDLDDTGWLLGSSGSPVFLDDKLVGIFSKFNKEENIAYIIPIYVLMKTLEKKDNDNIYCLETENITKINSYRIKDSEIYHPTLKITMPINTYFLLECDIDNLFMVSHKIDGKKGLATILVRKLRFSNENSVLINDFSQYKINVRLLTLMKRFNVNNKIITYLLMQENSWFTLDGNKLRVIKD